MLILTRNQSQKLLIGHIYRADISVRYLTARLPSTVRYCFELYINQGWAQGSFVEAEAEVKAERSRPRRGRVKSTLFVSF